ncbi:cysteine-rich receptor-like protein kinase 22 [Quercus suber]|uniref:Cysteine-rich receptor-like protein kinase 22 n=1 Tax=Quercus suber TaxID=58331 RepID=A0AAW0KNV7_QUESU
MKHISVIPNVDVGKSGGGDADGTSAGGGGDDGGGAVSFLLCTDLMHHLLNLRARNPEDKAEIDADDQISVVECLQFDFVKIRVATLNFSDANKFGKGRFGAVYKVI